MRRTLAQLRAQKSPLLQSYLHSIGAAEVPSCPLCREEDHTTSHLFDCQELRTELRPIDLWLRPVQTVGLVAEWRRRTEEEN